MAFAPDALSSIEPYEVLGLIGRGGMAEVYAVRRRDSGELYALKVVVASLPGYLARFEREAQLQSKIVHPNVLPMLEQHMAYGKPAILLPFVEGPTLTQLLAAVELPQEVTFALFRQVLAGVAALHRAKLVHRDLKPSNILFDPSSGRLIARVADFGVAKALVDETWLTLSGAAMGTPAYAAPEQMTNAARVDARADVFALGCILTEMLTGTRPTIGLSPAESLAAVAPEHRELILQMLARDPSHRPADASAVAALLGPGSDVVEDSAMLERCRALAPSLSTIEKNETLQLALNRSKPSEPLKGTLPAQRDPFVGRLDDLAAIDRMIAGGWRLLSVTGMGGTGKTCLSTHYARTRLELWTGGVWFCDLSEARSIEGVLFAVARALDVPLREGDPVVQLGHAIDGRGRCLVILDNIEQVAALTQEMLSRWLDRAKDAQFILTSRVVLGLPGEAVLDLGPMLHSDAVELFLRRASAASRTFAPAAEEHEIIDELVILLDHLPLAIELCAARSRMMSLSVIRARMTERFRLLTSPDGRSKRQATLKATLDWSWELLSETEKAALSQLSVCEGGFTLEAAEAVLDVGGSWAVDVVQGLIDKSFVRRTISEGGGLRRDRLKLLLMVQEYAASKLHSSDHIAAELRHGQHFAAFGTEEALDSLGTHGGVARWWALCDEIDNLVLAAERALARGEGLVAAGCSLAAHRVLERKGTYAAAKTLLVKTLTLPDIEINTRVRVRNELGRCCQNNEQALFHFETALRESSEHPSDRYLQGRLLGNLGAIYSRVGRNADAYSSYQAALAICRETGQQQTESRALTSFGDFFESQGRMNEANACYESGIAICRAIGDRLVEGYHLLHIGVLFGKQGKMEESAARLEEALAVFREVGDRRYEGNTLMAMGALNREQGRLELASTHFEEALAIDKACGVRSTLLLGNLGLVYAQRGRFSEAHARYETALTMAREDKLPGDELLLLGFMGMLYGEEGQTKEMRACYETALDLAQKKGVRRQEGIILGNLALLDAREGRLAEARVRYESALAIHQDARNRRFESFVRSDMGDLCREEGHIDEARSQYESALAIATEIKSERGRGVALAGLAALLLRSGEIAAARSLAVEGLSLLRLVNESPRIAHVLCLFAEIEHAAGALDAARAALDEASALATRFRTGPPPERIDEVRRLLEDPRVS